MLFRERKRRRRTHDTPEFKVADFSFVENFIIVRKKKKKDVANFDAKLTTPPDLKIVDFSFVKNFLLVDSEKNPGAARPRTKRRSRSRSAWGWIKIFVGR